MLKRVLLLVACVLLGAAAFAQPAPRKKLVLCWYMVCFGNSVEGYKQEIALAQRHGIDGFLLDVGEWKHGGPGKWKNTNYVASAERMYEAARQLNSGFVLAMAPEYSVQPFADNVYDMFMTFRNHPNQLVHDGKPVLSGYCAAAMFAPVMEKFTADGVAVCLVPNVFLPRFRYNPDVAVYRDEFAAAPYLDGLMMFNAEQISALLAMNDGACRAAKTLGKLCAAGVIPAYNSANLADYRGLAGYLTMWQGAIDNGADWISLVIWNDYNEDSALMPGRWPSGSERYLYDRDESLLQATAYLSAWFKTGRRPAITQDRFYVTYRTRSKWTRTAWEGKKQIDVSLFSGRFDQIHDDVEDLVYIDTFLTAPATVTVQLGKARVSRAMPAGIGHLEVPMAPGVPRVTLVRGKATLADVLGRKQIIDAPTEANSQLGYHHVNRTWMSGTVVGPVAKRLEAETGTLDAGAAVVTLGAVKAVRNAETKGSGVTLPVDGLATGTYNVRITYANPAKEEARLTLFADGAPRAAGDYPYFIPAFLPPTEKGAFQTVSFLWTLYDTTRTLKLQWMPGVMWGQPDPRDHDHGVVLIDAIALVRVEPVALPAVDPRGIPALTPIPGGTFTMGSPHGEPDERPLHQVTLADFAIGTYEVTNAEFERFDPGHRAFRGGNSWRDREPVVHVSWGDAAKYCNWLSRQAGLTPVYDEKTWQANLAADGFRLPTEAEWEYVATGRGEGRRYPWGNAAPVPGVHGRFAGSAALATPLPRPATVEHGAVVVGAYPAGASRDGVMDLAGNVGEWCTDWYAYYAADAQTNPCQATPGNFRVIRGGSWGWYGYSQRATDREFNSANYPGHAYYGFRVAVSAAGWKQLTARE
jgi:formylglycine-generating enzyme required for sulfatase activity